MNSSDPPREKVKAVIFDLDGVIFDSRPAVVALYNYLMEYVGLAPTAQESEDVIHRESMLGSLRHLMGEGENLQKALQHWEVMDSTPFIKQVELYPSVHDTLETLAQSLVLGVVTNRSRTTRPALEHFDLMRFFSAVVTPIEANIDKPHAAIMDHALELLGLTRQQVVYVGDSSVDQALCANTGVPLIAFRNPGLAAWAHVERFPQIPPLLEDW